MHRCEEFRERITEHIIDREDVSARPEFQNELLICSSCAEFYAESREMIEALSSVEFSISSEQWNRIEHRLRATIINATPVAAPAANRRETGPRYTLRAGMSLATAALLLVTIGLFQVSGPVAVVDGPAESAPSPVYVEQLVPLDPVTVDFLEQSELLLRNVMKITPGDADDLADAKRAANQQLAEIKLRKDAAANVLPVADMMDTYETLLRDLRNVDGRTATEDIPDIQKRIQRNALIANMKAFQPAVTQVSFGLR